MRLKHNKVGRKRPNSKIKVPWTKHCLKLRNSLYKGMRTSKRNRKQKQTKFRWKKRSSVSYMKLELRLNGSIVKFNLSRNEYKSPGSPLTISKRNQLKLRHKNNHKPRQMNKCKRQRNPMKLLIKHLIKFKCQRQRQRQRKKLRFSRRHPRNHYYS